MKKSKGTSIQNGKEVDTDANLNAKQLLAAKLTAKKEILKEKLHLIQTKTKQQNSSSSSSNGNKQLITRRSTRNRNGNGTDKVKTITTSPLHANKRKSKPINMETDQTDYAALKASIDHISKRIKVLEASIVAKEVSTFY